MKNKAILIALILTLAGMGLFASTIVIAENNNSIPFSNLATRIAERFNLNKNDVQQVFDQYRSEKRDIMVKKYTAYLDQLVNNGKITRSQRDLILVKHKELADEKQKNIIGWQNLTRDEKRVQMQRQKQALEDWAKQNNIDPQYLFGFGRGHFGGMKGGWEKKFDI